MRVKDLFSLVTIFVCMLSVTMALTMTVKGIDPIQDVAEIVEGGFSTVFSPGGTSPDIEAGGDSTNPTSTPGPTPFPEFGFDKSYQKPTGHAVEGRFVVMGRAEAEQQVVVTYGDKKMIGEVDAKGNYSVGLKQQVVPKKKLTVQLLKDEKLGRARQVSAVSAKNAKRSKPVMYCRAYALIDLASGKVLDGYKLDKKIYPASTTKMLTGIMALENFRNTTRRLTASKSAIYGIGWGGSSVHSYIGEKMSVNDWLHAMLLSSANEAAIVLAEGMDGSVKAFAKKMNEKAMDIGANDTHFINPNGLPKKNHYSTARDLANIARYAMVLSPQSKKFAKIVAKKKYKLPVTNKHSYVRKFTSTNKLQNMPSSLYTKVLGVKTGYTSMSSHNFVGCAEDVYGRKMLCVVAGVYPTYGEHGIFEQSKRLLEYGFKLSQGRLE